MRAVDWGSLFQGKYDTSSYSRVYHAKPGDSQRYEKFASASPVTELVLDMTESHREFYRILPDMEVIVPKQEQEEFFYSLKNGFVVPNVPAMFIYFAKAIFQQYRIYNLIGPLLPTMVSAQVCRQGYFGGGYTGFEVLCNFVGKDCRLLTPDRLCVQCGDWYEIYLEAEDMVVAVPSEVGSKLSESDIPSLRFDPSQGLILDNYVLAKGASYDLRGPLQGKTE